MKIADKLINPLNFDLQNCHIEIQMNSGKDLDPQCYLANQWQNKFEFFMVYSPISFFHHYFLKVRHVYFQK